MLVKGSIALFLAGTALHPFATPSRGILLVTIGRSMPQFALQLLLLMLVPFPLNNLSGGIPREHASVRPGRHAGRAPTTRFVTLAQAILFRGAGMSVIWLQYAALALIGAVLFLLSLVRFRRTIAAMA